MYREKVGKAMSEQQILLQRVDNHEINTARQIYTCQLSSFDADMAKVSQYLTQAILLEVTTHPKPGLVTRVSNGSHNDMSIFTFMMSSAVLGKAFNYLQDMGMSHTGNLQELFEQIRAYGQIAEKELLNVTGGVNTQRGILFAGGILSGVAGYAINKGYDKESIIGLVMEMTNGIVEKELRNLGRKEITAGEKLYKKYGITGIRGEVENGFPSVVNVGLPAMQEAFSKGATLNDVLVHTLLSLMTVVEDSNVIWRTGVATLLEVQKVARCILDLGSVFTEAGQNAIEEVENDFVNRRISPGGSADLLSITTTLYLLENKEFPCHIF